MNLQHLLRGCGALALACAGALTGCVDTDNRPPTLEYITMTILKPSCSSANCHSSLGKIEGLAFDTVEAARASFNRRSPGGILRVMQRTGDEPMPPNDIVPDADLELIQAWIDAGSPGL